MKATPRIACTASTTGARLQPGSRLGDLLRQALDPSLGIGDGVDAVLKHDLLCWMCEADRGQPAAVGDRPALLPGIDPTVSQQEPLKMLARLSHHTNRGGARPDQITHRIVRDIRHPDRRQFTGAVQLCQHDPVAPVGLHPVAGLHRDERGRDDHTVVPEVGQLAMQAIAAGPGFIAEVQSAPVGAQLLGQLADMVGAVGERAPVADLTAPFSPCNGHRNRRLVDIQPDEHAILHLVSPPFLRLGASQSGATLERRMPREGPPTQSANSPIMRSRSDQVAASVQPTALIR